jgi:histidine triad (HIT) family protein
MAHVADCIFCTIVAGEIPTELVADDEHVVAFHDLDPQAPLHVLVVPRTHLADLAEVARAEPATAAEMIDLAARIAVDAGHDSYRLVANTGAQAGQSVFHAHLHVLAGRSQAWPPG